MEKKLKSESSKTSFKKTRKSVNVKSVNDSSRTNEDVNVSVITKSTKPKVIVNSEEIKDNEYINLKRNEQSKVIWMRKFLCSIIMWIIILITFFVSLKIYSITKEINEKTTVIYNYLFE